MNIEQLNREFGIDGQLQVVEGKGGLPFVSVSNSHAEALISLYGGQLLSYKPHNANTDLMFCSEHAYYQQGKAIKGGVPICWPWFGADPENKGRPAHGFARNSMWQISETTCNADEESVITLTLTDSANSRTLWPHSFILSLQITIGESLGLTLTTRNTSQQSFTITQALHSYFQVGDIQQVSVEGLSGVTYLDKVDNFASKQQEGAIKVNSEVDRIYTDFSGRLLIEDSALNRQIQISSDGSQTSVVWNPWSEICAGMADLDDDAYRHFICAETANAADDIVTIAAGESYRIHASYRIQTK